MGRHLWRQRPGIVAACNILPSWVANEAGHCQAWLTAIINSIHRESQNKPIHSGPIAWDYITQLILWLCPRFLCAHTQVDPLRFGGKLFCVKVEKVHIATRQETVNHEINKVEGICGRAYIAWIIDAATRNGDECTIGIFLLSSDLTHNHGVGNLFSSVLRDIFKYSDAEGVRALHKLVLGSLWSFVDSLE